MRFRPRRPSPALVIACIALFVSMGGVSWAFATGAIDSREILNGTIRTQDIRNGTISTRDIRNNEVRGRDIRNSTIGGRDVAFNTLGGNDIKESTLGQVPSAARADSAALAGFAGSANTLGGVPPEGFVRAQTPAFTAVTLGGGWSTASGQAAPGYDVDPVGYVHLRGTMDGGGAGTAFTLPPGARPAATSRFAVRDSGTTATLTITPAGAVSTTGGGPVSLDGVTFAAAP